MTQNNDAFEKFCKNIAKKYKQDYSCCFEKGMENCCGCFDQEKMAWKESRKQAIEECLEIIDDCSQGETTIREINVKNLIKKLLEDK